jgi:hypothetical protein
MFIDLINPEGLHVYRNFNCSMYSTPSGVEYPMTKLFYKHLMPPASYEIN